LLYMIRYLYLCFVVLVALTNPINLKKVKINLDLYSKKALYLGI